MKKLFLLLAFIPLLNEFGAISAQSFTINTIAGGGDDNNTPATTSVLATPHGIAIDASGNIYVSDYSNNYVRMVNPSGTITNFAGEGSVVGYSGDGGAAIAARLYKPEGVFADGAGNVYISDAGNGAIRRVSSTGIITTIAGIGSQGFSGMGGQATLAELNYPVGVSTDVNGNVYVADEDNYVVYKINTAGIINIIAGTGTQGTSTNNVQATASQLYSPTGVAVDATGNVFIADGGLDDYILHVNTSGVITRFAGTGFPGGFSGDGGPATAAAIMAPYDVQVDGTGNVYFSDKGNNRTRMINTSGIINTVAGNGTAAFSGDGGAATSAEIHSPYGIAPDTHGNIFISDNGNNRVRQVNTSGIINTTAGNGSLVFIGDGGPATLAKLSMPDYVASDFLGNLYCPQDLRVRMVSTSGIISTFAGNGIAGFSGDGGPATAAEVSASLNGVASDPSGNIYIADSYRVRVVNTSGIISTFAGNGVNSYSGDGGPATAAELGCPSGIATDTIGNVYIACNCSNRIRMVNTSGIITTVAGNGVTGYSGDGGPATAAEFYSCKGINFDNSGNLYIVDGAVSIIRMVNTNGIISTFAGIVHNGYSGDGGPATAAEFNGLNDVLSDNAGNVYIADVGNNCIRMINSSGTISTVAGIGTINGFSGDGGPATSSEMYFPEGLALTPLGNIYIADRNNNRIREITNSLATRIPSLKEQNQITVMPNPSNGTFTFLLEREKVNGESIEIYTMLGEKVYSQFGICSSSFTIDLSSQPNGIYLYRVLNEEGGLVGEGKLVIEK